MRLLKKTISILLINVMIFTCIAFLLTAKEAKNVLKSEKTFSQEEINYIMSRDSWDSIEDMGWPAGLYCDKQPYINGKINQEYVNELISTYIDVSSVYVDSAIYVMAEDEQGMVAKPDNKIYFKCYPAEEGPSYFRVLDFTNLFSEDELTDMKSFF